MPGGQTPGRSPIRSCAGGPSPPGPTGQSGAGRARRSGAFPRRPCSRRPRKRPVTAPLRGHLQPSRAHELPRRRPSRPRPFRPSERQLSPGWYGRHGERRSFRGRPVVAVPGARDNRPVAARPGGPFRAAWPPRDGNGHRLPPWRHGRGRAAISQKPRAVVAKRPFGPQPDVAGDSNGEGMASRQAAKPVQPP